MRPEGADGAVRSASPASGDATALEHCLLLSLGHTVEITTRQWDAVFERSVAERCAALAWLRSESRIRTSAPTALVDRWTAWIDAHLVRVERQLGAAAEIEQWLAAHTISAVVLKGIPLASKLYGSWWARTVNDLDLYVPTAQCRPATDVLLATGWRHLRGEPPHDIELVKEFDGLLIMAELHGSLGGSWFDGNPFPDPEHVDVIVHGQRLRAHSGSFVPAYLASHLLQHSERPLLWILDFHTLWSGMLEDERISARASAAAARLGGALARAERWTSIVDTIARERDPVLVRMLADEILRPSPTAAFAQLVQSAGGALEAGRMVLQLIWPREHRGDPAATLRMWGGRIRKYVRASSVPGVSA